MAKKSSLNASEKRGRQRSQQILFGAPDEKSRAWYREGEVLHALLDSAQQFQSAFIPELGIWRTHRGYFRLFEHRNKTIGYVFGFHWNDLEVRAIPDPSFPGGTRNVLKNPDRIKHPGRSKRPERVYLAKAWPTRKMFKGVLAWIVPRLNGVLNTINTISDVLKVTTADEGILYETDHKKGVSRSGGISYVFKRTAGGSIYARERVDEIIFRSNIITTGSLANPFGENVFERLAQILDTGTPLFELLERRKGDVEAPEKRSLRKGKVFPEYVPYWRPRWEAVTLRYRHFLKASWRYLYCQDPATDDERKWNRGYYIFSRASQLTRGAFSKTKSKVGKFSNEKAREIRGTTVGIMGLVKNGLLTIFGGALALGGIAAMSFSLFVTIVNGLGLLRGRRIGEGVLNDLRDPLVKLLSKDSGLIGPFETILRPIDHEVFARDVNLLSTPTFNKPLEKSLFHDWLPPPPPQGQSVTGIRTIDNFEEWSLDFIAAALEERGRSFVEFYADRNTRPSANPGKDIEAIKIRRTDGLISVKFPKERRVWGLYVGKPYDHERTSPPPHGLLKRLPRGKVLEIIDMGNGLIGREISLEEAKRQFIDRFGRPLLERGLDGPLAEPPWQARCVIDEEKTPLPFVPSHETVSLVSAHELVEEICWELKAKRLSAAFSESAAVTEKRPKWRCKGLMPTKNLL